MRRTSPRLLAQRRGLHLQAVRTGDPEVEGGGVRPVVPEDRGSPRQAEELAESALFLNSVLDASTEYAIVAIDLEGNVVAWNEGAQRMYGYDAQQMVGQQHLSVVFPHDERRRARMEGLLDRAFAKARPQACSTSMRRNGEHFSGSIVVDLRRDTEGSDIGYVAITQDVSERLQAERERLRLVEVEAAHAEAKLAHGRFAFLAEASSLLTASLDSQLTLEALTRFVAPVLATLYRRSGRRRKSGGPPCRGRGRSPCRRAGRAASGQRAVARWPHPVSATSCARAVRAAVGHRRGPTV